MLFIHGSVGPRVAIVDEELTLDVAPVLNRNQASIVVSALPTPLCRLDDLVIGHVEVAPAEITDILQRAPVRELNVPAAPADERVRF